MNRPPTIVIIRIVIGLAGVAAIGYGSTLALTTLRRWPDVMATALWFGLPPLISDLILIPLIGLLGGLVAARVRPRRRAPVIIGLIVTASLLAVGWPFLAGIGRRPDNPSLLDRPYVLGTVVFLIIVWVAVAGWAALRGARPSRQRRRS